jgi:hypothetical protein
MVRSPKMRTDPARPPIRHPAPDAPRLVGRVESERLIDVWLRVTSGVVKYGFAVEYRDLEPPRVGTFDGLRITIDPDHGFEMQCFVLLHLFGHSVQWVAPALESGLDALRSTEDHDRFMRALRAYEFEAARFGLQLLREVGVNGLDPWYSDFVETDWRYVERFYRTGRIPPWEDCVATGCALIRPAPIPELRHRQVEVRYAF